MTRMHGARWFTLRHDFIDWFLRVIEPTTIVTIHRQLSIALGSSVQFLQARVREGEAFGPVHSPTDDFDVWPRFTFARCFQGGIEFAQRLDARSEPIGASQRVRQISIKPFCQVVVGPIWIWLKRPLHHVTVVVETETDRIGAVAAHISNLLRRQLVGTSTGHHTYF